MLKSNKNSIFLTIDVSSGSFSGVKANEDFLCPTRVLRAPPPENQFLILIKFQNYFPKIIN